MMTIMVMMVTMKTMKTLTMTMTTTMMMMASAAILDLLPAGMWCSNNDGDWVDDDDDVIDGGDDDDDCVCSHFGFIASKNVMRGSVEHRWVPHTLLWQLGTPILLDLRTSFQRCKVLSIYVVDSYRRTPLRWVKVSFNLTLEQASNQGWLGKLYIRGKINISKIPWLGQQCNVALLVQSQRGELLTCYALSTRFCSYPPIFSWLSSHCYQLFSFVLPPDNHS